VKQKKKKKKKKKKKEVPDKVFLFSCISFCFFFRFSCLQCFGV
jgi:hypothetical protein